MVCSHEDGVYCLKGETDQVYVEHTDFSRIVIWILSRNNSQTSYSYCLNGIYCIILKSWSKYFLITNPFVEYTDNCSMKSDVNCSDPLFSGTCDLGPYFPGIGTQFKYTAEVCDNYSDTIIYPPSSPTPFKPKDNGDLILFIPVGRQ